MSKQQFEGRSAAEAAIKACETLGVTRSELKYEVVSDTGELLSRKVVIAVEPVAPRPQAAERAPSPPRESRRSAPHGQEDGEEMPGDNRGNSAYGPDHGGARPDRSQRQGRSRSDRGDRGDRGERRSHGDRSEGGQGRGRRNEGPRNDSRRSDATGQGDGAERTRRPERDHGGSKRRNDNRGAHKRDGQDRGHHEGIDSLLTIKAAEAGDARHNGIEATSARAKRAVAAVGKMLELMGMQADVVLSSENEAELHVHVYGADEARIVGKKGEVLLALQFIVNRILSREEDEGEQVMVLDAGGYRERRQKALEELAKTLAERSVQERKAVRLSPMSAHDRRIFHMVLKDIDTVGTRSEGDGLYRHLLIIPAEFC